MIKSLVIYKIVNGEKRFDIGEVLSNSELSIIDNCTSSLSKYNKYKILFEMVLDNYLDLTQYLDKEEKRERQNTVSIGKVAVTVNRLTINYLSSAKLFIELSEKNIKKAFGENSDEFKAWKTATKKEFTENFSYRFLYHLRNFTQHYGFPIDSISGSLISENNKKINLFFVKDSLISNNYDWHKEVIKDLKQVPEKFPVFHVINDYNGCMARLYQTALKILAEELVENLRVYIKFLSDKNIDGRPNIITFKKPQDRANPNKYKDIKELPFDDVYECLEELEGYKVVNINYIN